MKILIPGQTDTIDGMSTYIKDLTTVLKDNGHYVYKEEGDFDIAFLKGLHECTCPMIIHEHAAVIPSLRYDLYKGWTQLKGRIVTVNSEFQRLQLVRAGVSASKIHWLPNCVDEDVFYPRDVRKMSKKILYLGRAGENNQNTFLTLLKAMERLPDFHLSVVGLVDNYIKKQLDKYDLTRVGFMGEIFNQEILTEIISMHSFGIGVGRSAMEMLLCGLPVMIFGLGWQGWVTEGNVETLHRESNMTSRMSEELSVDEKVNKICSAIYSPVPINREKAVEVFGMRKNLRIYELLFEELINEDI